MARMVFSVRSATLIRWRTMRQDCYWMRDCGKNLASARALQPSSVTAHTKSFHATLSFMSELSKQLELVDQQFLKPMAALNRLFGLARVRIKHSMKRILILLPLFFALCVSIGIAQQPSPSPTPAARQPTTQKPEDEDIVRITTNLVQVDAVVTDKNGKIVTDLKPEEVQIFEDGRQQKITHFSYYVAESRSAGKPAKPITTDKNAPPVPQIGRAHV